MTMQFSQFLPGHSQGKSQTKLDGPKATICIHHISQFGGISSAWTVVVVVPNVINFIMCQRVGTVNGIPGSVQNNSTAE